MRTATLALVVVAVAASAPAPASSAPPGAGARIENPTRVPDLRLRDARGPIVRLSALRGKIVLLTFLYTRCRDVCPLIAEHLNQAVRTLPQRERREVRVVAVSVDPAGDTRRSVLRFRAEHALLPQFDYLIGTRKQLAAVWRSYSVTTRAESGLVAHASFTLLVDRAGSDRIVYDATVRSSAVRRDLRHYLARR